MDEERIGVLSSATTTVASEEGEEESGGRIACREDEEEGVGFEGLETLGGGCLSMQGGEGSGMRGAECLQTRLEGSLSIHFGVGR